jgi:hypothetical protein
MWSENEEETNATPPLREIPVSREGLFSAFEDASLSLSGA